MMAEPKRKRPRSSSKKAALAEKQRAYRAAHPDRERATHQRHYLKYREKIIAKALAYVAGRPEKTKVNVAAWHARNKEWNTERDKAYREAHKERYAENYARYYAEHKERLAAYNSAYSKANPGYRRAKFSNRRARLLAVGGAHTADDLRELGERQGWICAVCRADVKENGHVDHFMPLKLGGSNGPENLQLLCKTCNLLKGSMHPQDFERKARRLGILRVENRNG